MKMLKREGAKGAKEKTKQCLPLARFAAFASSRFNVFFDLLFAVKSIKRMLYAEGNSFDVPKLGFSGVKKNPCRATNFAGMGRNGARPFDGAQGRLFDGAQGRLFDGAQGRLFDGAQGRLFDGAQGRGRQR
jgi:hypothetical protein